MLLDLKTALLVGRNKFEAEIIKSKGGEAKLGDKIKAKWRSRGFCELALASKGYASQKSATYGNDAVMD